MIVRCLRHLLHAAWATVRDVRVVSAAFCMLAFSLRANGWVQHHAWHAFFEVSFIYVLMCGETLGLCVARPDRWWHWGVLVLLLAFCFSDVPEWMYHSIEPIVHSHAAAAVAFMVLFLGAVLAYHYYVLALPFHRGVRKQGLVWRVVGCGLFGCCFSMPVYDQSTMNEIIGHMFGGAFFPYVFWTLVMRAPDVDQDKRDRMERQERQRMERVNGEGEGYESR